MAKKDLLLNPCGDLMIRDGDFVIVEDADQVRQSWLIRVRTFRGEWLLDAKMGLPYFQEIFEKGTSRRHIEQLFIDLTLATPGVLQVISASLESVDPASRNFQLTVEAMIEGPEHATFRYDSTLAPASCPIQGDLEYPLTIPNLALWFDAQDLSKLTWDGTHLIMQNKAGTGRAVGAGDEGEPALQGSTPINNHRAVFFHNAVYGDADLRKQRLIIEDTPAMNALAGRSLFVVFCHQAHTEYYDVDVRQALCSLAGVNPVSGEPQSLSLCYVIRDSADSSIRYLARENGEADTQNDTTIFPGLAFPEILTLRSLPAGSAQINRNGTTQTVSGSADEKYTDGSGLVGAALDSLHNDDSFFNGHIGEILAYDRLLDDTEVAALTLWLRNKWGFTFSPGGQGFGHGPFGHGPFGH